MANRFHRQRPVFAESTSKDINLYCPPGQQYPCPHRPNPQNPCTSNPCKCAPEEPQLVCMPATISTKEEICTDTKKPKPRLPKQPTFLEKMFMVLGVILVICLLIVFSFIYTYYIYDRGYEDGYDDGLDIGALNTTNNTPKFPTNITPEDGPCRRNVQGSCPAAEDTKNAIRSSRYYLNLGDAESALRNWDGALTYYRLAKDYGSSNGAQAALDAARRIQFQTMTCEYTDESLARISRGAPRSPQHRGDIIDVQQKQRALLALSYYIGDINNTHGPATREAIRKFQGDLWFDRTGVLTAEQTVLLICGGAQIAKDTASQNVLGIMYAGGLGVRQNTDYALEWLESALRRNHGDAAWNLALLYGTGTVLSSVRVCDAVQNADRADGYLKQAIDADHPAAQKLNGSYAHLSPENRWRKIKADLNTPNFIDQIGHGCNP